MVIDYTGIFMYTLLEHSIRNFKLCGYPIFPAAFIQKTVLSPLNGPATLVKNHSNLYGGIYFWYLYFAD